MRNKNEDLFPVWAVVDQDRKAIAYPYSDGTVDVFGLKWDRARWKEYKSQVDELFDIAEAEDPA
jgi:hypothetical protein